MADFYQALTASLNQPLSQCNIVFRLTHDLFYPMMRPVYDITITIPSKFLQPAHGTEKRFSHHFFLSWPRKFMVQKDAMI